MIDRTFRALVVSETAEKNYERALLRRKIDDLPPGDVLVRVAYSSLNYKDALSAVGNRGVTRAYPHTPGIDAAGVVEESADPAFRPGDEVIVTSYDLGMNTPGGFGEYIRVPAGWVVPLPRGLTLREAMILGTAGFTAALSALRLVERVPPERGTILVSGATGGVGSLAVKLLVRAGYRVAAVNGVVDEAEYLRELGAAEVLSIAEATDESERPLLPARFAGAIDTVGGPLLATSLRSVGPEGVVTTCGNAASAALSLTVYPFILRGVTLAGINSQSCPMELRKEVWERLAGAWKLMGLEAVVTEIPLEKVGERIDLMLARKHRGRTLVRLTEGETAK